MTSATRRRCGSVSRGKSNGVVMLAPTQRTQPGHLVLALDPAPLSEAASSAAGTHQRPPAVCGRSNEPRVPPEYRIIRS